MNSTHISAAAFTAVALAFSASLPGAQTPGPTVLAGGGPGGIAAIAANIEGASGVALDGAGDVYVAAALSNRVYKVAPDGVLTVVAGTGNLAGGYGGDGGPATAATLNAPQRVAVDAAGDVFIADSGNQRIREVPAASGIITTVAGNGQAGYSGDGGPATAASLHFPAAVALDAAGDLYIADWDNFVVREVVAATGAIRTVAGVGRDGYSGDGGPATAAELGRVWDVALDAAGDLFICDGDNGRIREVSASTGVIETVAGGAPIYGGDGGAATAAGLGNPEGIALDSAGDLFISEFSQSTVREVSASNGLIATVAGTPLEAGYGGDGGPALQAMLYLPEGIAVDGGGDLFIADCGNGAVREAANGGNIGTIAGNHRSYSTAAGAGTAGLGPVWGVAISPTQPQTVYYSSLSRYDTLGPYVAGDPEDWVLSEVARAETSGALTTVAGSGVRGYGGDGGAAADATLNAPLGLAADAAGNLYIADSGNNVVREVSSSGTIATVAGNGTAGFSLTAASATAAQLRHPAGVAVDAAGNLYIADSGNNAIHEVLAGGAFQTLANTSGAAGYSGDGGAAATATLRQPLGLAVDGLGNVYIADTGNNAVREIAAATGVITTVAGDGNAGYSGDGGPAVAAALNAPAAVAVDSAGDLIVADTGNGVIREVTAGGTITTLAGGMTLPLGLAVDTSGDLIVADPGAPALLEWPGLLPAAISSSLALQVSPAQPVAFTPLTLSASVGAGATAPAGTVTFHADGQVLGTAAVNAAGNASLAVPTGLAAGSHELDALFSGASGVAGSGATAPLAVARAPVSVTLTCSENPAAPTQSVALTATIQPQTGGDPTGTVTFASGNTAIATATVSGGAAEAEATDLAAGADTFTAAYAGDANFLPQASAPLTEQVVPAPTAITLTAAPDPAPADSAVTLTAGLSSAFSGGFTGTVTFLNGGNALAAVTLTGPGTASFTTTALPTGANTLSAAYSGNAEYTSASTQNVTETVLAAGAPAAAAGFVLTAANGSSVLDGGGGASYALSVDPAPPATSFNTAVTFSIAGLPPGTFATFSPASVVPGAGATVTLSVQSAATSAAPTTPSPRLPPPLLLIAIPAILTPRRRLAALLLASLVLAGCGGNPAPPPSPATAQSYVLEVTATSGSLQQSVTLSLTVEP